MIPADGAPGHPLNPYTEVVDRWRNARRSMPDWNAAPPPDPRETAIAAGVPLLLIGLLEALTEAQRAAVRGML